MGFTSLERKILFTAYGEFLNTGDTFFDTEALYKLIQDNHTTESDFQQALKALAVNSLVELRFSIGGNNVRGFEIYPRGLQVSATLR
jgi:hypothetical protein